MCKMQILLIELTFSHLPVDLPQETPQATVAPFCHSLRKHDAVVWMNNHDSHHPYEK